MKQKYKIKKVDEFGRINLPIRFRKKIDIISGQYIKMKIENDKIIIEKIK